MISPLISLLIAVVVVAIICYLLSLLVDMLPVDPRFKQIARILILLIAVLILLARALPLVGVSLS